NRPERARDAQSLRNVLQNRERADDRRPAAGAHLHFKGCLERDLRPDAGGITHCDRDRRKSLQENASSLSNARSLWRKAPANDMLVVSTHALGPGATPQ